MSQEVCVFGGIYFVCDFILNIVMNIIKHLPHSADFLKHIITGPLSFASDLLFILFVILLFRYVFTAKSLWFVQKIIDKFPKISVYLYYLGFVGYIVLIINALLFAFGYFLPLSENMQNIVAYCLIVVNICGLLLPLILGTYKIFSKPETK